MKRVTFYVVLESQHSDDGKVTGIRADRLVSTKPTKLSTRHVALKLNVDIDESVFQQYLPEATVTITDRRDLLTPDVHVEQDDPEKSAA